MANEPYSPVPSVSPSGPAGQYESVSAPPTAFGAQVGQAEQRLGGATEEIGAQLDANAIRIQDLNNQADSRAQLSKFLPEVATAWAKYGTLNGKAAADALPSFMRNLQDIQQKHASALASPMARNDFMNASSYLTNRLTLMGSTHAAQQQKAYWQQTRLATIDTSAATAGFMAMDPDTVAASVNAATHAADENSTANNIPLDSPIAQDANRKAVGRVALSAMVTQLGQNPALAQKTLEMYGPRMDAETLAHAEGLLRSRIQDNVVGGAVSDVMSAPLPSTPNPAVVQQIKTSAAENGVPVDQALTIAHIESHTGTVPDRPGSQYKGIYQLGDNERASVGLTGNDDQTAQAAGGVRFVANAYRLASDAVGAPAQGWQTYMVHQQGAAGGPALLKADPNVSAADVLASAGSKNAVQAITANGGTPDMTVGQFLQLWQDKYARSAQAIGQPTQSGPTAQLAGDVQGPNALAHNPDTYMLDFQRLQMARERAAEMFPDDFQSQRRVVAGVAQEIQQNNILSAKYEAEQAKAVKDRQEAALNEYVPKIITDPTTVDVKQMVNDPRIDAAQKWRLNEMLRSSLSNKPKQAAVSHQTAASLLNNMRLPSGDPARITDLAPLYDAYTSGKLTSADFNFVQNQFKEMQTPEGEKLNETMRNFLTAVKPSIEKSNPIMGLLDMTGGSEFFRLQQDVAAKVTAYRAAGKDPYDLFRPGSPDYIGSPANLSSYQKSIPESLGDFKSRMQQQVLTASPAPARPPLDSFGLPKAAPPEPVHVDPRDIQVGP